MSRKETIRKIKDLRQELKVNKGIIKTNNSPHQRDLARNRINLLRNEIKGYESNLKVDFK